MKGLVMSPCPPASECGAHRVGNAIKLRGRTFLAPHRGSSPKGEARHYAANDFLNLIALTGWGEAAHRLLSFTR